MRGSATLAMVLSSACMIEASMTVTVISTRCGPDRRSHAAPHDLLGSVANGCLAPACQQAATRVLRMTVTSALSPGAAEAAREIQRRRRTGTRCTTFTQLPVAFSGGTRSKIPIPACGGRSRRPQRTQLYSRAQRTPSSVTTQSCRPMPPPALKHALKYERSSPEPRWAECGPIGSRRYPSGAKVATIASMSPASSAAW